MDRNTVYLNNLVFYDAPTFHMSGYQNRTTAMCGVLKIPTLLKNVGKQVSLVLFFKEDTIINICYLTILELYTVPQIKCKVHGVTFQEDGHNNKLSNKLKNSEKSFHGI
jgi:hypothetical protein